MLFSKCLATFFFWTGYFNDQIFSENSINFCAHAGWFWLTLYYVCCPDCHISLILKFRKNLRLVLNYELITFVPNRNQGLTSQKVRNQICPSVVGKGKRAILIILDTFVTLLWHLSDPLLPLCYATYFILCFYGISVSDCKCDIKYKESVCNSLNLLWNMIFRFPKH